MNVQYLGSGLDFQPQYVTVAIAPFGASRIMVELDEYQDANYSGMGTTIFRKTVSFEATTSLRAVPLTDENNSTTAFRPDRYYALFIQAADATYIGTFGIAGSNGNLYSNGRCYSYDQCSNNSDFAFSIVGPPNNTPIDAVCGSATSSTYSSPPTSNLCSPGDPTSVATNPTTYTWTCNGPNGGNPDSCTAPRNAQCGSAINSTYSSPPTANLCSVGNPTPVATNPTTYTWTCNSTNGGNPASCTAPRSATPPPTNPPPTNPPGGGVSNGLVPCGETLVNGVLGGTACGWCQLFQLAKNIIDFLTSILFAVVTLMVTYGGVRYLTSFGSTTQLSQSRQIITMALWGFVIGLLSYFIVGTIINVLAGTNSANTRPEGFPWPWDTITCQSIPGQPATRGAQLAANRICAIRAPNGIYACISGSNTAAQNNACNTLPQCQNATCEAIDDSQCGIGNPALCTIANAQALAQQTNSLFPASLPRHGSPALEQLLSCIEGRVGRSLGRIYTVDESHPFCNFTRGATTCGPCSHTINSCHYGGSTGTQGAEAADIPGLMDIGADVVNAARLCGAREHWCETNGIRIPDSQCPSGDHVHVSSPNCG